MKRSLLLLVSALLLLIVQNAPSAVIPSFSEDWSRYQPGGTAAAIVAGGDWSRYGYSTTTADSSLVVQSPPGLLLTNNSATFMGLVSKNAITLGSGIRYDNTFRVLKEPNTTFQYVRMVVRSADSESNLYIVDIRPDKIILRKKVDGTSTDLDSYTFNPEEFAFFTDYRFSLEIVVGEGQNELRILQDGAMRFSFTDMAPPVLGTEVNIGFQIRQGTPSSSPVVFGEVGAAPIPEPSSLAALLLGGGSLVAALAQKNKKKTA